MSDEKDQNPVKQCVEDEMGRIATDLDDVKVAKDENDDNHNDEPTS